MIVMPTIDFSQSIDGAIGSYFNNWLQEHWPLNWIVANPLGSLLLLGLIIILFWGLLSAIGRGVERFWVWLLQTPLKILKPLILRVVQIFNKTPRLIPVPREKQIDNLVQRLGELQQEQEQLLQELSSLVREKSGRAN
jgi:hypothetical protein